MSIDDLAVYLGVAKRTIYKYIADGDCPPYIKLSTKNISFDRADVDAWLESKKVYPEHGGEKTSDSDAHSGGTLASPIDAGKLPWTPRAKGVLNAACRQAREDGLAHAGTEHVLLGILSAKKCLGAAILERLDVSEQKCRQRYEQLRRPSDKQGPGKATLSEDVEQGDAVRS